MSPNRILSHEMTSICNSHAVLIACLVAFSGSATGKSDGGMSLSDKDVLAYQQEAYDRQQFMHKTIAVGSHNGIKVIAEHPCSDVCPQYTVRIVRYSVPIKICHASGGAIGYRIVPHGIAIATKQFCVPAILETIPEYKELKERSRLR